MDILSYILGKKAGGGGGGGSSDFSTAHVTIINSQQGGFSVSCPNVFDAEEGGEEVHVIVGTVGLLGNDEVETTAVLYKGSMVIYDPNGNNTVTAVSGSAEIMDGGYTALVTGDATVTF